MRRGRHPIIPVPFNVSPCWRKHCRRRSTPPSRTGGIARKRLVGRQGMTRRAFSHVNTIKELMDIRGEAPRLQYGPYHGDEVPWCTLVVGVEVQSEGKAAIERCMLGETRLCFPLRHREVKGCAMEALPMISRAYEGAMSPYKVVPGGNGHLHHICSSVVSAFY